MDQARNGGANGDSSSDSHRLLNEAATQRFPYPTFPTEKEDAVAVPFLKEPFVIDPESMKVWQLTGAGPVPKTDGFRVNFSYMGVDRPEALSLAMTRACDLRCRYCFVHNRPDIQDGNMSVETALKGIKLCNPRGTSISFFGGEPLLRFEAIKAIVEHVRWMCENPNLHMTTNGVLLDDAKADFFALHGFNFIVSLDGPPEVHNYNRPLASGEHEDSTSYDLTLKGLSVLKRHDLNATVTLRSTFTKDCVRIAERLAHLNDLCDQGLAGHVAVEPVSSSEASCIDPAIGGTLGFSGSDALKLRRHYEEAFEWALQRARSGKEVRWHHVNQFAQRILLRRPGPSECGAGKGYIGIDPEGRIFACHRETGKAIGHVDTGFDERVRACWLDNRLFVRQNCPDCWCRFICGGGCRADSVVHQGDIRPPYVTGCTIFQIMIAYTIRLLSELTEEQQRLVAGSKEQ